MNKLKQAFTLVELIVVITIIAILWTIAFISLQWYSISARDSVRISDMSKMKSSLELFQLNTGKYPLVTEWTIITYSWAEVWTQWIFWNTTFNNVKRLDKIPTDPLTERKYTYSTTNTRNEYQIAWILEWDLALNNSLTNETFAGDKIATLKVIWNYNGKVLKVSTWSIDYILALPSLITSSWLTLEDIVINKLLAYDGYKNLPSQYEWSPYNTLWDPTITLVNNADLVVYSWDLKTLSKSDQIWIDARVAFITSLQNAYTWTTIKNEWVVQAILLIDVSTSTSTELLSSTIINNNLWWSVVVQQEQQEQQEQQSQGFTPFTLEWDWHGNNDYLNWVKIDSNWNIYVVWYSYNTSNDFYVRKLDNSWTEIWSKEWDWYGGNDNINWIDIDSSWNIYISWHIQNWTQYDFYLRKLDSTWTELWLREWDWHTGNDFLKWITIDSSWNIFVVWYGYNASNDFYIRKLDNTWTTIWTKEWDWFTSHDYLRSVTVDLSWNIYVAWQTYNSSSWNFYVRKLDSAWIEIWTKEWDWYGQTDAFSWIKSDSSWNIYIVGSTRNLDNGDFYIRKLDSSWTELWVKEWDWHLNTDYLSWIDIDSNWNIYVVWNSTNSISNDFYVRKLNSTWTEIWVKEWDWHGGSDYLTWIDIDSSWNIYVSWLINNGLDYDFYLRVMDTDWN
jgi:prepilin-type N-terminal cleavage/methylation domain-containing protein